MFQKKINKSKSNNKKHVQELVQKLVDEVLAELNDDLPLVKIKYFNSFDLSVEDTEAKILILKAKLTTVLNENIYIKNKAKLEDIKFYALEIQAEFLQSCLEKIRNNKNLDDVNPADVIAAWTEKQTKISKKNSNYRKDDNLHKLEYFRNVATQLLLYNKLESKLAERKKVGDILDNHFIKRSFNFAKKAIPYAHLIPNLDYTGELLKLGLIASTVSILGPTPLAAGATAVISSYSATNMRIMMFLAIDSMLSCALEDKENKKNASKFACKKMIDLIHEDHQQLKERSERLAKEITQAHSSFISNLEYKDILNFAKVLINSNSVKKQVAGIDNSENLVESKEYHKERKESNNLKRIIEKEIKVNNSWLKIVGGAVLISTSAVTSFFIPVIALTASPSLVLSGVIIGTASGIGLIYKGQKEVIKLEKEIGNIISSNIAKKVKDDNLQKLSPISKLKKKVSEKVQTKYVRRLNQKNSKDKNFVRTKA